MIEMFFSIKFRSQLARTRPEAKAGLLTSEKKRSRGSRARYRKPVRKVYGAEVKTASRRIGEFLRFERGKYPVSLIRSRIVFLAASVEPGRR